MARAAQDVLTTASRHAQPRAWLRAVEWLVGSGIHPRASAVTVAVARDLAARMDYGAGTVLYDLEGTAGRVGISRAGLKRHVAYLRELGALVWLVHGSKRNLRLPGRKYTATATVYAAAIPPVYDAAMGHRVPVAGYEGRVTGLTPVPPATPDGANCPCGYSCGEVCGETVLRRPPVHGLEPPSRTASTPGPTAEVERGFSNTRATLARGRNRAPKAAPESPEKAPRARKTKQPRRGRKAGSTRRSPLQVAKDIQIARQVRPRVNWTQGEGLRRLAFSLRPLIDQGLDADTIAAELHAWFLDWRPADPAAYIRTQLRRQAELAAQLLPPDQQVRPQDNAAWRNWCEQNAAEEAARESLSRAPRTDEDRATARARGTYDITVVLDHLDDHGTDDTLDLYGTRLTSLAARMQASGTITPY
ncbi:cell wall protein [Streptomyces mauvecolor]|uniref:Cell wall protein n=1 Tax=Streptomyces mauvecolor TaxID=58345 RepID=A0ABV9UYC9_9ACTN